MTMTRGNGISSATRTAPAERRRDYSPSRDFSTEETTTRTLERPARGTAAEQATRHRPRALVDPSRTGGHKRLQRKPGSQQVISVRGRRVIAPKADPKLIRSIGIVTFLLCLGVALAMALSGASTEQTFRLQQLTATETQLSNEIESLNRDVENARSSAEITRRATELGMVVPVQPGILTVEENGDTVEQRPSQEESRPIIDINGQPARAMRASSNPDETNEVSDNLEAIPQGDSRLPTTGQGNAGNGNATNNTMNSVPYQATTRDGGVGQ